MTLIAAATVAGCALEVQNRQPRAGLAQAAKPPGSVYTGWRVFQERWLPPARQAAGSSQAPDLLMMRRHVAMLFPARLGLRDVPPEAKPSARAGRQILQRRQGALVMPA